jgi:hypothetical protein
MPTKPSLTHGLLPLALALAALTGCAAPPAVPGAPASDATVENGAPALDDDFAILLDIERAGVGVLADQWTNNDCSVELALGADDLVCADIISGADLTQDYDDLAGGLDQLPADPAAQAVRMAFSDSVDAARVFREAGCDDELSAGCADDADELVSTLLALDAAFDAWPV